MSQSTTETQYGGIIDLCKSVFQKKNTDYGTSWRVYRPISVADQLYIKARRIRNIQEGIIPEVKEGQQTELIGIVNYAVIGLMQLQIAHDDWDIPEEEVSNLYNQTVRQAADLLKSKNHDYGEAWRDMDIRSITDLILAKILRVKQIIKNEGKTLASEGIDSNYYDILNYAVFALILMNH